MTGPSALLLTGSGASGVVVVQPPRRGASARWAPGPIGTAGPVCPAPQQERIGDDVMRWRWTWRRPARMTGPNRAAHGSRSRAVWADLAYPDAVLAQAAELTARQAEEWAALERVLNEPTLILERGVRGAGAAVLVACRRAGRWEVRHAA